MSFRVTRSSARLAAESASSTIPADTSDPAPSLSASSRKRKATSRREPSPTEAPEEESSPPTPPRRAKRQKLQNTTPAPPPKAPPTTRRASRRRGAATDTAAMSSNGYDLIRSCEYRFFADRGHAGHLLNTSTSPRNRRLQSRMSNGPPAETTRRHMLMSLRRRRRLRPADKRTAQPRRSRNRA